MGRILRMLVKIQVRYSEWNENDYICNTVLYELL